MCLLTDEINVEIHQSRATIFEVAPVLSKSFKGYRNAKREAFKIILDENNNYDSVDFYTTDSKFLKNISM